MYAAARPRDRAFPARREWSSWNHSDSSASAHSAPGDLTGSGEVIGLDYETQDAQQRHYTGRRRTLGEGENGDHIDIVDNWRDDPHAHHRTAWRGITLYEIEESAEKISRGRA